MLGDYLNIELLVGSMTKKEKSLVIQSLLNNESLYNNLNTYKIYINTIFDGANDAGYYFDYNKDNTDIIVKSIFF